MGTYCSLLIEALWMLIVASLQAGLPADYYRWLCGPDDEDLAAAVESPEWQMSPLHFVTLVENFRLVSFICLFVPDRRADCCQVPPGQRPA
jgi:hypothetical protein